MGRCKEINLYFHKYGRAERICFFFLCTNNALSGHDATHLNVYEGGSNKLHMEQRILLKATRITKYKEL